VHTATKASNHLKLPSFKIYYSALVKWERSIMISVCLSVNKHISGTARPIFTKFFVQIACGRGSVRFSLTKTRTNMVKNEKITNSLTKTKTKMKK